MKTTLLKYFLLVSGIVLAAMAFHAPEPTEEEAVWGFFGHRRINRLAVFTLPPELFGFYKKHIEFVTEHAVDPDKRRYATKFEAPRHYIDLDRYGKYDPEAEVPFPEVPRNWTTALQELGHLSINGMSGDTFRLRRQYIFDDSIDLQLDRDTLHLKNYRLSERDWRFFYYRSVEPGRYEDLWTVSCDSLRVALNDPDLDCASISVDAEFMENGILPWHLQRMVGQLSRAFEKKDIQRVLRYSSDMGHYIGDAHVPLHTTENYNGQLTGQTGIHAFWETRIPELFADEEFDYFTGPAEYIDDVETYVWDMVLSSHAYVDSVLLIEAELRRTFPQDMQMCYEQRGSATQYLPCEEFAFAYKERMRGMVEERMRRSIQAVGNLWYTAWVDAGQPPLEPIAEEEVAVDEELEQQFQAGKLKGRTHDN